MDVRGSHLFYPSDLGPLLSGQQTRALTHYPHTLKESPSVRSCIVVAVAGDACLEVSGGLRDP